jgi:two-component system response regulator ArlR
MLRDGKSGWELAQTYQYDLVILDLMLPQLSGGEVLLLAVRRQGSQPAAIQIFVPVR